MKKGFFNSRIGRGRIFALISALAILVLFALNLLLTYVGIHKTVFIDMTPEGLYTVSDAMERECEYVEELDGKVTITFCSDVDVLLDSLNTRIPYFLATKLDNTFENIELQEVNVTYNPTAVAKYKASSLSKIKENDIIVSYGDRYRVLSADSLWRTYGNEIVSFDGEYKLASIIKSVTAKDRPKAYFLTGHGETVYNPSDESSEGIKATAETEELFYMLQDRGLEVKLLDLSKEDAVPEDCVLLIINNPRTDLTEESPDSDKYGYVSETEKIDRYLVENYGSLMVAKDYAIELPVFEAFLGEWGFKFSKSVVSDESLSLDGDERVFAGVYDTDEDGYAYAIYEKFASLSSAPEMVFGNTGHITSSFGAATYIPEPGNPQAERALAPFFFSSNKAESHKFDTLTGEYTDIETEGETLTLAAVSTRLEVDSYAATYDYSYVMCAASADFFSGDYIGNPAYANYDVLSLLIENMIRTDRHASIELGGNSENSENVYGKFLLDTEIYSADSYADTDSKLITPSAKTWLTVLVMLAPVAVAAIGIVIKVKRRYL